MSKRFGYFPVIGDGQSPSTAFRSTLSNLSPSIVRYEDKILIDSHTGQPVFQHAMSRVAALDMAPVAALSNSYLFPDAPLDVTLASIDNTRPGFDAPDGQNPDTDSILFALKQAVQARGFTNGWLTDPNKPWQTWLYRELLTYLVHQLEPAQVIESWDVAEPQE